MSMQKEKPFDWRNFERLFDELFPNAIPGVRGESLSKIGQFVQGVVENVVPTQEAAGGTRERNRTQSSSRHLFQPIVHETDRYVKVRFRIPDGIDSRKLQLFIDSREMKIEGPLGHVQVVSLPAPVSTRSGRAVYRNGTMMVTLRKRKGSTYRELFVDYP